MLLVTGASGFVGSAICTRLAQESRPVKAALRQSCLLPAGVLPMLVGEINGKTAWAEALQNVSVVIHLAARVHVMDERAKDPLSAFRQVNVQGTLNLARQAAAAGVKRFVFMSSIKVNGEATKIGQPFFADQAPHPEDPYGISKHEAEQALRNMAQETGMKIVIIRPPLVYGAGVKANFASLMRSVARGMPLPLASITHNRRSFIALDNLVDFVITCIDHPAAANQTFLVSDDEDASTAELLQRMGEALGKPARLFPMPEAFLKLGASLIGRQTIYERLCGSLQVDIGKAKELLSWSPPIGLDEGLRRSSEGFCR